MKKKAEKKDQKIRGKKTKLTKIFLNAAKEVINEGRNAFIATDEELVALINDKLVKEERIGQRTFRSWKAGDKLVQAPDKARKFRLLLKRALFRQKRELFTKMENDEKGWQRYAWMLERKFAEWNLKYKADLTTDGDKIVGFNFIVPQEEKSKQSEIDDDKDLES